MNAASQASAACIYQRKQSESTYATSVLLFAGLWQEVDFHVKDIVVELET